MVTIEKITPTAIVRVHIPEISEEERRKRMRVIEQASINILTKETEQK